MKQRLKWYVGIKFGRKTVFSSAVRPTPATHGHRFNAIVGPYKSKKDALVNLALM